jgi:hypothetical protein
MEYCYPRHNKLRVRGLKVLDQTYLPHWEHQWGTLIEGLHSMSVSSEISYDDLDIHISALDALLEELRSFARRGIAFNADDIAKMLVPELFDDGTPDFGPHCELLTRALAVLLQRTVFG